MYSIRLYYNTVIYMLFSYVPHFEIEKLRLKKESTYSKIDFGGVYNSMSFNT